MNRYTLTVVRETGGLVYFNMFVNATPVNPGGVLCLKQELFDQLFKDLFRGSKGNCIKAFCAHPKP